MKKTLIFAAILAVSAAPLASAGGRLILTPPYPGRVRAPAPPPVYVPAIPPVPAPTVYVPAIQSQLSVARPDDWMDGTDLMITEPENATFETFQAELAPHGTWIRTTEHGWAWQPRVAVQESGWRPYCQGGRWIWTDRGWYWQSSYAWGAIPFHYGRWVAVVPFGWVWVPAYEWAPAWVHWRHSDSHCGWAPLPPGAEFHAGAGFSWRGEHVSFGFGFGLGAADYVFVPSHRFLAQAPCEYAVPYSDSRIVYQNTTVIYNDYRTLNGCTVYTGLPPTVVHPRGSELPTRRVVRGTRSDMADGGRLSRVMSADAPPRSQPSGRIERIVSAPSRASSQPAPQAVRTPAPVNRAAAVFSPAPSRTPAAPPAGRVARVIGTPAQAAGTPARASVGSRAPSAAPKTVAPASRAPTPSPAAPSKSSSSSRVRQVRELYNERYGR